ncbi:MAG: hypothetical protein RL376_238, partial [Verrucomicrobiota bacterium]
MKNGALPCSKPNAILNLMRGLASLVVLAGHIRLFLFCNYNELSAPSFFVKLFYYITGFGSQAVVIFFVLSGYLVGGSVLNTRRPGFWPHYLLQRLSRLWVVLIPCLVITFILNKIGMHTGGVDYLAGIDNPPIYAAPDKPVELGLANFFSNLAFLQTIAAPVFGDNQPLWSLSNEFMYYLLFPLVIFGFQKNTILKTPKRLVYIGLSIGITWMMPPQMRLGFLVWCMGAATYVLSRNITLHRAGLMAGSCVAFVTCGLVFHFSRVTEVSMLWIGLTYAILLFFSSHWRISCL